MVDQIVYIATLKPVILAFYALFGVITFKVLCKFALIDKSDNPFLVGMLFVVIVATSPLLFPVVVLSAIVWAIGKIAQTQLK